MLVLAVVVIGAAWCVDGCLDPTDKDGPLPSSGRATCTMCVMPFATVIPFALPEQRAAARTLPAVAIVHLWVAPIRSIDHPPRLL